MFAGEEVMEASGANLGHIAPREGGSLSSLSSLTIESETFPSLRGAQAATCLAQRAKAEAIHLSPRRGMDSFAQPVIGRAFARPVGSQ